MTCRECGETKPATKFPTARAKDGTTVRVDRCRSCRDAAATPRPRADTPTRTYPVGDTPCSCTADAVPVVVPPRFWDDHVGRACLGHVVDGAAAGSKVRVWLRPCDRAELLSDARHYATSGTADFGADFLGVVSSARATVRALT